MNVHFFRLLISLFDPEKRGSIERECCSCWDVESKMCILYKIDIFLFILLFHSSTVMHFETFRKVLSIILAVMDWYFLDVLVFLLEVFGLEVRNGNITYDTNMRELKRFELSHVCEF